jgi:hypothetical protein
MSQVQYQASLARRDDLLRTASERRRAELASVSRRGRVTEPAGMRIVHRVRRVLSPVRARPVVG